MCRTTADALEQRGEQVVECKVGEGGISEGLQGTQVLIGRVSAAASKRWVPSCRLRSRRRSGPWLVDSRGDPIGQTEVAMASRSVEPTLRPSFHPLSGQTTGKP